MTENIFEKFMIEEIKRSAQHPETFHELTNNFEKKLDEFNPTQNCMRIKEFFGVDMGQVNATRALLQHQKIEENWLRDYSTKKGNIKSDFKGLYVFLHDNTPFYIGISKGVIGRILQHVKGTNHNSAPLAYNIAVKQSEFLTKEKYLGSRNDFDFKKEAKPVQEFLLNQQIAFLNIENDEELYLFEVYCSMKFSTDLNKFETH
jgi:hypothetical protein